jgi:regulatory protein
MNQKSGEENKFSQELTDPQKFTESRPRKKAREKVMDLLARRDHSEFELRKKLSAFYEVDEVNDAIEHAKQNKWLRDPRDLAASVAEHLARKNKGARYIQQYLSSRGLPSVAQNFEDEHRKALELVATKLRAEPPFAFEMKNKIARLLKNRGFDDETIRKVIHEKS